MTSNRAATSAHRRPATRVRRLRSGRGLEAKHTIREHADHPYHAADDLEGVAYARHADYGEKLARSCRPWHLSGMPQVPRDGKIEGRSTLKRGRFRA